MTFFLILSLTLSASSLHITQEHGTFPSRLSCEDYLEDLALHLRLPADTKVRLECKRAPSVRFNPNSQSLGRSTRKIFGNVLSGGIPHIDPVGEICTGFHVIAAAARRGQVPCRWLGRHVGSPQGLGAK